MLDSVAAMRTHKREAHGNATEYHCPLCPVVTRTGVEFLAHWASHLEACSVCGHRAATWNLLQSHEIAEHGSIVSPAFPWILLRVPTLGLLMWHCERYGVCVLCWLCICDCVSVLCVRRHVRGLCVCVRECVCVCVGG
ncbi:MAG: hypothetical protein P4L40_14075 [Terracidiphilus sp.]|nr:hypothetical protein [Terracidiphilus sp.]